MNAKILVCCHKESPLPHSKVYLPIQVGKAISNIDLGIQGDNTGENISEKNESFCELTGMYWAWKNLKDVDVIGLCHYRRFFDFHHQCELLYSNTVFGTSEYDKIDLSVPDKLLRKIDNRSIVAAVPIHYEISLYNDYCRCHVSDDILELKKVIEELNDQQYVDAFTKVMYQNNKLRHFNMFIMTWDLYNEYCEWLFGILFKVEKRIDIANYSVFQKRVFGYMAERLLNVFIEAKKLKVYEKKVMWFNDQKEERERKSKYMVKRALNYIGFKIMRPIFY